MFTLQAVSRANGFAQIAIDPRGGTKSARLYVTWSDYRNGDVDVFSRRPRITAKRGVQPFVSTTTPRTTARTSFFNG